MLSWTHGLQSHHEIKAYAHCETGDGQDNTLYAGHNGDWLFGLAGNDILIGDKGNHSFAGGADDDEIYAGSGWNTLSF